MLLTKKNNSNYQGFQVLIARVFPLILLFFTLACTQSSEKAKMSKEARALLKNLKKLELPPYTRILGTLPNKAELELGRQLFSDPILSRNNDVSCASCHLSNHGFADGNSLSVGALGRGGPTGDNVGRSFAQGVLSTERGLGDDGFGFFTSQHMFRNALSTVNVAYRINPTKADGLFWDGRFGDLSFQSLLPIHTSIEMCGNNPVPTDKLYSRIFEKGGPLFREPVSLSHTHSYDPLDGSDTGKFNAQPEDVFGVPTHRLSGQVSIPTRNECLAIAIAKLRGVPAYRKLFKEAFGTEKVSDHLLSQALASYMLSHVAIDTPYDMFVSGENSLSPLQLVGLVSFMKGAGEKFILGGKEYTGVGCAGCHEAPEFGGNSYASLGVRSDPRSSLSKPTEVSQLEGGFFSRQRVQRGKLPNCHIQGVTVTADYAPDIGRAAASHNSDDCFAFRVPPLRNVIETFPYFHHGSARAQSEFHEDLESRSLAALKQVVEYHLRGPIDPSFASRLEVGKIFFDETYQKDLLIPFYAQNFLNTKAKKDEFIFPLEISDYQKDALVEFIAYGLYDPMATKRGGFDNDVTHPRVVLSGFHPSISRDNGHQGELPPNFEQEKDRKTDALVMKAKYKEFHTEP